MAIKTVIGAIRAGGRFFVEGLARAGVYGAAQISSIMKRYPGMDRATAAELGGRIMGEVVQARRAISKGEGFKLRREDVPTQRGLTTPYKARARVVMTDSDTGIRRSMTVSLGFQGNPAMGQVQAEAISLVMDIVRRRNSPLMRALVDGGADIEVDLLRILRRG